MFITFEGLDFCGKSTQVKLLTKYLTEQGKRVELIREPGGTTISEEIRNVLLDRKNDKMFMETELLLYSSSRAQLVRERILPLLEKEYYVISDRFHDSSIAYQGYGRGIDINRVKEIQYFAIGSAIPDITFLIDIPVEEVNKRKAKFDPDSWDRIEISGNQFYEKVRQGYHEIAKTSENYIFIDGLKTIEQIHEEVVKAINNYKN
jgi:dTMP kinase